MKASASDVCETIRRTIAQYDMIPPQGRLVAGLSGGADSMALAHFLLHFIHNKERLVFAHVNHCLRGAESDRDEAHVRAWCAEHRVTLRVERVDVRALAQSTGRGEEECGREARYRFFRSLLSDGDGRILTAHTLSDSCETLLLHLARGTGARGLCGIPPIRGNIVRPLIALRRSEVELYCSHYGVPFVTDSTNAAADYARNRIRNEVSPVLQSLNPAFETAMARAMRSAAADDACLMCQAEEALARAKGPRGGFLIRALLPLPEAVRADTVEAENVSGATNLFGSFGSMQGESVSGRLSGESDRCPDEVRFNTVSGAASLSIPDNEGFTAEYDTVSGSFTCGFAVKSEKDRVIYRNGAARFHFETVSGGISLSQLETASGEL